MILYLVLGVDFVTKKIPNTFIEENVLSVYSASM